MQNTNITSLTLTRPDDWHCHLRDDIALERTVPDTARYFGRAIVMPNLRPPVTTTEMAIAYLERIKQHIPARAQFSPLMTLYLTDNTSPEEINKAKQSGVVHALKLYPAGATTNSDAGVTNIQNCYPTLEAMQSVGMPLLIHGEVTDKHIDIFDREKVFIDTVMTQLVKDLPELKIVFEHITTADAVQFVSQSGENIAATITPQHLLMNRNDILVGGIRPHNFCLPVLKRNTHQQALIKAVSSGSTQFFLGTDSAPHPRPNKENSCGCAGMYSAHAALELYATAFEKAGALDKLEAFASFNGADFYGLPRNTDTVTLIKKPWTVPDSLTFSGSELVPMSAGDNLDWQVS